MIQNYFEVSYWNSNSTEEAHKIIEEHKNSIERRMETQFPYPPLVKIEEIQSKLKLSRLGFSKKILTTAKIYIPESF